MRGAHQTGLFSDGCVEAGQQPDQGEKETGAASGIEAGGDTAGAGQPHPVWECKGKGEGGYATTWTEPMEVRDHMILMILIYYQKSTIFQFN